MIPKNFIPVREYGRRNNCCAETIRARIVSGKISKEMGGKIGKHWFVDKYYDWKKAIKSGVTKKMFDMPMRTALIDCRFYDNCLDEAAMKNEEFCCKGCNRYKKEKIVFQSVKLRLDWIVKKEEEIVL